MCVVWGCSEHKNNEWLKLCAFWWVTYLFDLQDLHPWHHLLRITSKKNVDYVGNISVVCSHSSSQHSLPLLTGHVLYGNWLCSPHFNCWRVMRSASAVQNLASFVYILDHVHPWVLYHKNQWNDAKKKNNLLIFRISSSDRSVFHWAPCHSSKSSGAGSWEL